jgi:coatomer protein complex subunit gamma
MGDPSAALGVGASAVNGGGAASPVPPSDEEAQSLYAKQLSEVPELASYGPVLKSSSKPVELTESETEYVVTVVKHVFKDHVVFQVCFVPDLSVIFWVPFHSNSFSSQFNVHNTLPDTVLERVSVVMSPSTDDVAENFIIPAPKLASSENGIVYVSFSLLTPGDYALASFSNSLKFVSKEVDPVSGEPEDEGYEDEYQIEDVELGAADYILPTYVTFATEWDRLRSGASGTETFALSAMDSIKCELTPPRPPESVCIRVC